MDACPYCHRTPFKRGQAGILPQGQFLPVPKASPGNDLRDPWMTPVSAAHFLLPETLSLQRHQSGLRSRRPCRGLCLCDVSSAAPLLTLHLFPGRLPSVPSAAACASVSALQLVTRRVCLGGPEKSPHCTLHGSHRSPRPALHLVLSA